MGARISVVMPCFDAAAHLAQSIASVRAQTLSEWELVFVDDGSTDGSVALAEALARDDARIRVVRQPNRGVCAARNAGLAAARGEYLAFLDADDTWEPDFLAQMLAALEAHPQAGIAYCGWQNLGLPGGRGQPYVPPELEGPDKLAKLFDSCQWPIHACLARLADVRAAGGFDPRFKTSEDMLLWLKLGKSRPLVRVPRVLAYYHFHDAQTTRDKAAAAINHLRVQKSFVAEFPDDAARIPRAARRASMQGRLARKGLECHWAGDIDNARAIFRALPRAGRVAPQHWKYWFAALLPRAVYARLLGRRESAVR
ncbi:MAG: glycosyltransferase [Comamonadaceae bacterium]|nr:glycosyltransferase [Rubrivivax sp.]NLZ40705.1 glycosyltransferase [Comamonadaceae bacterium]